MLGIEVLSKYGAINIVERYKQLSDIFQTNDAMEIFEKNKIISILKKMNCGFIFNKREHFFGLQEEYGDWICKINLSIKYGRVEPIIWAKNIKTNEQFGGALIRVCRLIQISNADKNIELISYPSFSSYQDLELIFGRLFRIYEDFKLVFLTNTNT